MTVTHEQMTTTNMNVMNTALCNTLGKAIAKKTTRPADVIHTSSTGAVVCVGNFKNSRDEVFLDQYGIRAIVNCCGTADVFKGSGVSYFSFNVCGHQRALDQNVSALDFFKEVFDFIDNALANGISVLIHCVAGAHRAGTTGVAYLMYKTSMDTESAIAEAKRCRPIIDPIMNLRTLLCKLHIDLQKAKDNIQLQKANVPHRKRTETRVVAPIPHDTDGLLRRATSAMMQRKSARATLECFRLDDCD